MTLPFHHRAEQVLLQTVRRRRRERNRRRGIAAALTVATLLTTGLWLHRAKPPLVPVAATATLPNAHRNYREITTGSQAYTLVHSSSDSPLLVVHTGDLPRPLKIDDNELFALLPDAVIRIGDDRQEQLILPR